MDDESLLLLEGGGEGGVASDEEGGFSDQDKVIIWQLWTSATAITMSILWLFIISILFSWRTTLKVRFNLYLLFSLGPELIFNTMAFFSNVTTLTQRRVNDQICKLHGWYANFYIAANFWMIATITYQIHKMLRVTKKCQRYSAPTSLAIVSQSLTVYLLAALYAAIYLAGDASSSPAGGIVPPITNVEIVCIPIPMTSAQKWFNYAFMWGLSGILPSLYILSVAVDIWYRQLLPLNGKTREVALYYMRLIVVFMIIWIAFVMLHFVGGWFAATAAFIYDLTGIVSVAFALTKKDISTAFYDFVKCLVCCHRYDENNGEGGEDGFSSRRRGGRGMDISSIFLFSKRQPTSSSNFQPKSSSNFLAGNTGNSSSAFMIDTPSSAEMAVAVVTVEDRALQHNTDEEQPQLEPSGSGSGREGAAAAL